MGLSDTYRKIALWDKAELIRFWGQRSGSRQDRILLEIYSWGPFCHHRMLNDDSFALLLDAARNALKVFLFVGH